MAVALGVASADTSAAAIATISTPSFTVGAGITALLVVLSLGRSSGSDPTSVTCVWNTVSSMAQILGPVKVTEAANNGFTYFFWIANPIQTTAVAKASWTNNNDGYISVISFSGTDTTTPFINATSATNQTGVSASLTVTVPTGGAAVSLFTNAGNGWNETTGLGGTGVTAWYKDQSRTQNALTGYGISSSNLTFTGTQFAGADNYSVAGVAVQPPAGGKVPYDWWHQGGAILAT